MIDDMTYLWKLYYPKKYFWKSIFKILLIYLLMSFIVIFFILITDGPSSISRFSRTQDSFIYGLIYTVLRIPYLIEKVNIIILFFSLLIFFVTNSYNMQNITFQIMGISKYYIILPAIVFSIFLSLFQILALSN